MQDPKFEKEVQRRMHDLEFAPSESVWAGIRQGIAPRKRRRVVAALWWLIPGMLLLTGGIVLYRHSASTAGVAAVVPAAGAAKPAGGEGKGLVDSKAGSGNIGSDKTGTAIAEERRTGNLAETGTGNAAERRTGNSAEKGAGIAPERGNRGVRILGSGASGAGNVENGNDGAVTDVRAAGGEGEVAAARIGSWQWYQPGLIGGIGSRSGVMAPPLVWKPANPAVSGIRQPRHPWMAGFAAGGGGALIHATTGNPLAYSSPAYPSLTLSNGYVNQFISSTSGGSKQIMDDVRAGYSYWAGIYGEKQLSARWSVDIGLNLHYYSVEIETNNQVSVYTPSSSSLFISTPYTNVTPAPLTNSYLGAGAQSSYTYYYYYNRYYFLEVPATVQYKLNHSRALPLFWRGGAVFSWLMSSNGLYYDNSTGTYEKGNGLVRRAQAGVNSGLMVGLPIRGVQIQAGPEVQYALTGMLTAGPGGGHMVYGGMRVAIMR